jgi:hypothetical protein
MDRDTMEFFHTMFDSLKREMHQEFEDGRHGWIAWKPARIAREGCCRAADGRWPE